MKVFMSFSDKDHRLIHIFSAIMVENGVTPLIASQRLSLGGRPDEKVREMIADADCVIVLLTPNAARSRWVQQEIGCAKALSKHIVPLKTRTVRLPAMLEGVEYYQFSKTNLDYHFSRVAAYLCEFAAKNGLKLLKSSDVDRDEFMILHLPNAMLCRKCKNVDVHVGLCLLCGDWLCVQCGETVPSTSRAKKKK